MVNTFVTSNSVSECASNLDNKRLGKQRVEAKQIIDCIESKLTKGFGNHPATLMWKDHIIGLKYYCNAMIKEWKSRKNSKGEPFKNTMEIYELDIKDEKEIMPWWFYCKQLQLTHKCSLLRKNPVYYKFELTEKEQEFMYTGYMWPHKLSEKAISKVSKGELRIKLCEPLGCGVPPQYRITKKEVEEWLKDKLRNPKTGRKITKTGNIYKDYKKARLFYKTN